MQHLQDILDNPLPALAIVGNLILIESLLSVDNAAVLATMVTDLPEKQRNKALKYGILGAYVFRGICLVFAAWLVKIWWLKPVGGLYLLFLCIQYFVKKHAPKKEEHHEDKQKSWIYRHTVGWMGAFWSTVVLVEIMDLAFSIDNVFAAVAFTDNLILIYAGVFIGILAMRFVAQGFVKLIARYSFLEPTAFIVIGILGIKLCLGVYEHLYPETAMGKFLGSHAADWATSAITIAVFLVPVLTSYLFNVPAHKSDETAEEIIAGKD